MLQAFGRMVLAKRLLLRLKIAANISKYHHHRTNVVSEMLSTEETYVADLEVLVKSYFHPLKKLVNSEGTGSSATSALVKRPSSSAMVTLADVNAIFSNIEVILEKHRLFLQALRAVVASWHETSVVGPLFVDMVCKIIASFFLSSGPFFMTNLPIPSASGRISTISTAITMTRAWR